MAKQIELTADLLQRVADAYPQAVMDNESGTRIRAAWLDATKHDLATGEPVHKPTGQPAETLDGGTDDDTATDDP